MYTEPYSTCNVSTMLASPRFTCHDRGTQRPFWLRGGWFSAERTTDGTRSHFGSRTPREGGRARKLSVASSPLFARFLAEERRAFRIEIDPNSRRCCTPCGRYSTSSLTSPGRAYRRALLPVRNGLGSCVIRQREPHHTVQRAQASGYDVFSQPPRSGCRGRVGYGPISCKNEECNIHKE